MKKRILAVLLMVPFGIALAQNGAQYNTVQEANASTALNNNSSTVTYDSVMTEIKNAIIAIKNAIVNVSDPVALQEATTRIKIAAQAVKALVMGTITNSTAQTTAVSNSYDRMRSLGEAAGILQTSQPVNAPIANTPK